MARKLGGKVAVTTGSMAASPKVGLEALLTPDNCVLVLIDHLPDQTPIDRTFINAWEDERVVEAVKRTGRRKIVFAALRTEMRLAMPAIQAMGDGYDGYVVTDASGGVSVEAHDMAIRRLVAAGASGIALAWEMQLLGANEAKNA